MSGVKRVLTFLKRHTRLSITGLAVLFLVGAGFFVWPRPTAGTVAFSFTPPPAVRQVSAPWSAVTALRPSKPGSPSRSPLLLFFPATGAQPQFYTAFESAAAQAGYHVLALPYANRRTERSICGPLADCYDQIRAEQFTGAPSQYLPPPARSASITAALPASLTALSRRDPDGGWGQYLHGGLPEWQDIVTAGHSQGGALAAYIAHRHTVRGVIMFSSPNDVYLRTGTIAGWLRSPSATPLSRYAGFVDTHDFYDATTSAAWRVMLPGRTITPVDAGRPLAGQLFSTSVAHFTGFSTHFAVARDTRYAPVWRYLLQKFV